MVDDIAAQFHHTTRRPEWHRFALPDEFSTSLATRLTAVIQQKGLPKPWLRHKSNNSAVFRHLCFVFLISRQNSSSGSSAFFSSRKPGWIFSYEPKAKFVLVSGPAWSTGLIWRGPQWFLSFYVPNYIFVFLHAHFSYCFRLLFTHGDLYSVRFFRIILLCLISFVKVSQKKNWTLEYQSALG